MEGCALFYRFNALLILSRIGSQGFTSYVLFPIQALRERIASPSFAMWIRSLRVIVLFSFIFLVCVTVHWCSSEPIGIISVFSMLNFAPDTSHHAFRRLYTSLNLSLWWRYRAVSSAKNFARSFSFRPRSSNPLRVGPFRSLQASGSIAKSKARQESGSPCQTPRVIINGALKILFTATVV